MPEEELKKLSQREAEWRAMAQAYQKRWEVIPKAKSALDTALLEAEVVWGRKIEKAECFNQLIGELLVAIEDHIEAMNPNVLHEQQNPEEIKKRREIMYARGLADKDEFRKRLEAIISDVEEELKPRIKRYHR